MSMLSRIKSFCFTKTTPHLAWAPRPLRILIQLCGRCVLLFLPVYCLCMVEYIHYADKAKVFTFFLERRPAVLFDLLLLYLLWLCVLLIIKKGWVSVLLYAGFTGGVAAADYLKYAMTGDYLYPWDILEQTGNLGELMNFITVPFPILYTALILFGMLLAVPVFFAGAQMAVRWYLRYPVCILLAVCAALSVSTPQKIQKILNKSSLYLEDMALQSSNYNANGFVGAFTVNVLSSRVQEPEGYGEDAVYSLLADYDAEPAKDSFSSPDIILVLSESFWDVTMLDGTTFTDIATGEAVDPLANYRALSAEENAVSGRFFTTGFGGGTVRPEFEVLTGLTTDYLPSGCVPFQYIKEETPSYVSAYRDIGYTTLAVHPYTSSFYARKTAYPKLGIDTLCFEDALYALGNAGTLSIEISGKQIADTTFEAAVEYYLAENAAAPTFLFGISMENHQPYTDKFDKKTVLAENDAFDEAVLNAVQNFTQGVTEADASLGQLAAYVKNRDKDTILIWFGDHLPTLGTNFGAYAQSGMVSAWDEGDYEKLYSTPFLIYANFDLSESSMLHKGNDNAISSYNLMNAVSELIGSPRTAYMNFLRDYAAAIPYYNIRLHKTVSDAVLDFVSAHRLLTYDIVAGKRYALDK